MTPALSHIEEAERILCGCAMRNPHGDGALNHADDCAAQQTMGVAQALADRDEKLAQAGVRIEALEAEAKRLRQTIHSMSMGEPS